VTTSESDRRERSALPTVEGCRRDPGRLKLQAVTRDGVYATAGRTVYCETTPFEFERVGSIPVPDEGLRGLVQRLQTARPWKPALEAVVGSYQTVNLWAVSDWDDGDGTLLATVGSDVFRSTDGGRTWSQTLELHSSSPRMGTLPTSLCSCGGTTYLAEYPLSESTTPRVFLSTNGGRTWEPFLTADVRHFHSVAVDPHDGALWLTTGDRDSECRILRVGKDLLDEVEAGERDRIDANDVQTVGGGSQRWRAVELAFTPAAIVWGMDCAYVEENELLALPRSEVNAADPTPQRIGAVNASVYYAGTVAVDGDEWVVLSTAAEAGGDRTAPPGMGSTADRYATVVAAPADDLTDWRRLLTYTRHRSVADRIPLSDALPTANAYVLLASAPERGLLVNPVNTVTDDGRIRAVSPAVFSR